MSRFFGWIFLIVIALSWIRLLSGLADEPDVVISIGAALLITVIPAFFGIMLLGAGSDQASDSALPSEPESEPRKGGFLRFIGWIIVGLTTVAWIVLVIALINDPAGIVGIVLGGLVVSVIPLIAALILIGNQDMQTAGDQGDQSAN